MEIIFHGQHSGEEAADSLVSILRLFKDRYAIDSFAELTLNITLLDENGENIELVDATTSEVLGAFEVYQANDSDLDEGEHGERKQLPNPEKGDKKHAHIRLVVDNTKKSKVTNK